METPAVFQALRVLGFFIDRISSCLPTNRELGASLITLGVKCRFIRNSKVAMCHCGGIVRVQTKRTDLSGARTVGRRGVHRLAVGIS